MKFMTVNAQTDALIEVGRSGVPSSTARCLERDHMPEISTGHRHPSHQDLQP